MRKLLTILLIFCAVFVNAQQLPHYSLYMLNDGLINPSSLCRKSDNQITLMVRDQWSGFKGAPKTQSISYYNLNHHKYKRGINLIHDLTGPISIINASLTGSYTIPIQDNNIFAIGGTASIQQYKFDNTAIKLEDDGITDPAMQGGVESVLGHSVNFGAYYYNSKFFVGFSVPNIIGSNLDISYDDKNNQLEKHYYLNGGMNFDLGADYELIPSIMFKKIGPTAVQMDLNIRAIYSDFFWGGLSYRTQDAIVVLLGLDYSDYGFGYSYDITTSNMRIPSAGSHGLLLTYKFKVVEKDSDNDGVVDSKDDCPKIKGLARFNGCPDSDGDGVMDKEDECPTQPGLPINNGCPDMDSDGVIDKYDRCRDTPGLKEHGGCPDTDGDGLVDDLDRCPYTKGVLKYLGCPDTITIDENDTIYIKVKREIVIYDSIIAHTRVLIFDTINFAWNKSDLTPKSAASLDLLVDYLNTHLKIKILIQGHTDETGTNEYNKNLAYKRAVAVKRYLVKKGIKRRRIKTKSFGESVLKNKSGSDKAHSINRRVEFIILNED